MHRRLRRQRAAARLLLRVTKAQELLAAHHSAQQPPRPPPTTAPMAPKSAKGKGKGAASWHSAYPAPWHTQGQPTQAQYPVGQGVDRWKVDEAEKKRRADQSAAAKQRNAELRAEHRQQQQAAHQQHFAAATKTKDAAMAQLIDQTTPLKYCQAVEHNTWDTVPKRPGQLEAWRSFHNDAIYKYAKLAIENKESGMSNQEQIHNIRVTKTILLYSHGHSDRWKIINDSYTKMKDHLDYLTTAKSEIAQDYEDTLEKLYYLSSIRTDLHHDRYPD